VLMARGSLALPGSAPAQPRGEHQGRAARRRLRAAPQAGLPDNPYSDPPPAVTPLAPRGPRGDAAARRPPRRSSTCASGIWDLKADLRRRSPDRHGGGPPRSAFPPEVGGRHRDDLPERSRISRPAIAEENTIFLAAFRPEQKKKALVLRAGGAGGASVAMIGDGGQRRPGPERRARMAVAMGSGKPDHQGKSRTSCCWKDQFLAACPRAIHRGAGGSRAKHPSPRAAPT